MIKVKIFNGEPYLEINNQIIERNKVKLLVNNGVEIIFEVFANEVVSDITKIPFNKIQLSNEVNKPVTVEIPTKIDVNNVKQRIFFNDRQKDKKSNVLIDFSWDFEKWNNIFSTEELTNEATGIAKRMDIITNYDIDGYDLSFTYDSHSSKCIEDFIHIANDVTREAINQLIIRNREGVLTTIFEFPEHVRVPCEQYLIYFSEFLKNVGIEATTEITHESGNVLFTVVPVSKEIALSNIQEALEMYLQLPSLVSDTAYMNYPTEPQNQQLMATVQHFKSQIMLLNATIQMQSQTIGQQKNMIDQQKRIMDTTILQTSMIAEALSDKNEDEEELFKGAFTLNKIETKLGDINVANIYRRMKSQLQKKFPPNR